MIIDAHCHFSPGIGGKTLHDARKALKRYERWAREAGIDRTVLFSGFHRDYRRANQLVGQIVSRSPEKYRGLAFVHARRDRGRIFRMVQTVVEKYGFLGIKVHGYDAPITDEICRTAQTLRLPVLYDVLGRVETVPSLARKFPDVNFIIPHLGTFENKWRTQIKLIPMLEKYKNIYTDTSSVKWFELLEMAVKRAGAHKVLFGTDGPWLHPKVELEKVYALHLPPEQEQLILAGNIIRLTKKIREKTSSLNGHQPYI